jgi:hypothetical protein
MAPRPMASDSIFRGLGDREGEESRPPSLGTREMASTRTPGSRTRAVDGRDAVGLVRQLMRLCDGGKGIALALDSRRQKGSNVRSARVGSNVHGGIENWRKVASVDARLTRGGFAALEGSELSARPSMLSTRSRFRWSTCSGFLRHWRSEFSSFVPIAVRSNTSAAPFLA